MTITAKRFNLIMTITMVLLIFSAFGITLFALNVYGDKSEELSKTKLEALEATSNREIALAQKAELVRYKSSIELLEKIVPKSKDQALAIAELQSVANDNNITIGSLTFPASELGSSKSTSENIVTQSKKIDGISGVLGVELTISQLNRKSMPSGVGISYSQLINVLEAIERNRRTMQIKNIQIQPIMQSNTVTGYNPTITINLFVKP